jgi:hypothetical protein
MQLHSSPSFVLPSSYTTNHTHPERDLPMHSMHTVLNPHSPKLINPAAFIKKVDGRLNS